MIIRQFPDRKRFHHLANQSNVVPVCMEILADTETPVSLLRKFYQNRGPLFLFESVEGGERWGRYSFLGISARKRIRIFDHYVEYQDGNDKKTIPHKGDPLKILKEICSRYHPAQLPEMPRFWSGLVGYMTYEMVSFFEPIRNILPPEKAMADFMIPDSLLIFDNVRNTLLIVAIAFTDDFQTITKAYQAAREQIKSLLKTIQPTTPERMLPPEKFHSSLNTQTRPEAFRDSVSKVKTYIRQGDVIQTVISQRFTTPAPEDLWHLYRTQRYVNPSPYLFFLHLDDTALVGSSPETMVRVENGIATLRPIAGTRPRGKNEQEDHALANELLMDEKERAEHLMLVDLGRNDLGRVAETGSVQVTDLMVVERYSHVMHMVSNITCNLEAGCDAWDLLSATFPAGTLTGAPKVRAMEIIQELEETHRGPYGGAVGYISFDGNMDLAITIRTALIEKGELSIRAGAGIVADSNPEDERIETINKSMAIQRALNLMASTPGKRSNPHDCDD